MPSPWTRLRLAVDPLVRPVLYTAYRISHDEYVDAMERQFTIRDARDWLQQNAYEPQYLSAAKYLPGPDRRPHELSYRRVPGEHPPEVEGTALEGWRPEQCQYHVHVFNSDDSGPLFFSHYEVRPDFFEPRFNVARLHAHYRPTWDRPQVDRSEWSYLRGVTDLPFGNP